MAAVILAMFRSRRQDTFIIVSYPEYANDSTASVWCAGDNCTFVDVHATVRHHYNTRMYLWEFR